MCIRDRVGAARHQVRREGACTPAEVTRQAPVLWAWALKGPGLRSRPARLCYLMRPSEARRCGPLNALSEPRLATMATGVVRNVAWSYNAPALLGRTILS